MGGFRHSRHQNRDSIGFAEPGAITMRFRVLGPLRIARRGESQPEAVRGRRRRTLLAALLAEHGRSLTAERLYKLAWPDDEDQDLWELEPDTAKNRLHPLISKLRTDYDLESATPDRSLTRLVESGGAYMLHVAPMDLDSILFEQYLTQGDRLVNQGDVIGASDAYEAALRLWDGEPFEAMQYPFLHGVRQRFIELSLKASNELITLRMRLGAYAVALAELEMLLSRHPTDERLNAQKMLCLYLDGRRNDALAHYYTAYKVIREQTGNLPGKLLLDLERRVRADDTSLRDLNSGQAHSGARPDREIKAERAPWVDNYRDVLRESLDEIDFRAFGSTAIQATSLDAVYTPILVRSGPGEGDPDGYRQELEAVVAATRTALVVGESGGGKSTFLQHLCRGYLIGGEAVPILVDLVDLNSLDPNLLSPRDQLPWDVLLEAVVAQMHNIGITASAADLERMAQSGDAIWLLDGLNEIANPTLRDAVMDLVGRHATRWRQARFVVTTTAEGIDHRGTPRGFTRIDVGGFDAATFLDRFTASRHPELADLDRRRLWEPLAATIRRSTDLRLLARWPLYLTALALTYFTVGHIPETRMAVLRAAVNWLIRRRRPSLRAHVTQGRYVAEAFQHIAHAMAAHPDGPRRRVGKVWAQRLLKEASGFDEEQAAAFIDSALSGGGLLAPCGHGDLEMHDAFRDLLAAQWIARLGESDRWNEIESHLDEAGWFNLIRLVPACLYDTGSEPVDEFFDRLGHSCRDLALALRAPRLALGTAALQELMSSGYELPERSGWREAISALGDLFTEPHPYIPLHVRFGAAVGYGLLGDRRLEEPHVVWVSIEGATFRMGAQAEDEAGPNFDRDAAPWEGPVIFRTVAPFALRRFPMTVQEFRPFVEGGGYRQQRYWSDDGWWWRLENGFVMPLDWEDQLLVPNAPVTGVSWYEAVAYCRWLTDSLDDGQIYRLPREVEWEYAARRGVDPGKQFPWGNRMRAGDHAEANWAGASLRRATPVGMFPCSTTRLDGLADLYGNVEEWCLDIWSLPAGAALPSVSPTAEVDNTLATDTCRSDGTTRPSVSRVVRGGSCIRFSRLCRPSYRSRILQEGRYRTVGFRPAAELQGDQR